MWCASPAHATCFPSCPFLHVQIAPDSCLAKQSGPSCSQQHVVMAAPSVSLTRVSSRAPDLPWQCAPAMTSTRAPSSALGVSMEFLVRSSAISLTNERTNATKIVSGETIVGNEPRPSGLCWCRNSLTDRSESGSLPARKWRKPCDPRHPALDRWSIRPESPLVPRTTVSSFSRCSLASDNTALA